MRFGVQPWLWVVPLLPVLWLALRLGEGRNRSGLRRLLGERASEHVEGRHGTLLGWDRFLLLAGLFWLLIALARPQWGASEVTVTQRGSDVVVALDISNSMLAEDVAPSRLERAKTELGSFLGRVQESRIGLVFFAGAAFVQCPLTLDYGTADMFLKMADTDLLSEQGTNIGAALATARQLLAKGRGADGDDGSGFQAILLVTDGEDLEGDWEKEAEACRKDGIRVIPVGVGSTEGGLIPAVDRSGRPAGYQKDDEGNVVTTHLNLEALEKLGAMGDAGTFRLGIDGLAGDRLYRELQRLGRRDLEDRRVSAYQERYIWPLALAILCFLLRLGLRPRRGALAGVLAATFLLFAGQAMAAPDLVRAGAVAAAEGRRLYGEGDFEKALTAFEGAVVQAPDDPVLSLAVGETLFRLERYPEAMREFDRALALTDDPALRAEALYNRGTTALSSGDAEAAAKALRESLALAPERTDALVNLEAALRRLEQQQKQDEQKQDEQKQDEQKQDEQKQDQQKQDQQKQDEQKQDQQKQDEQKQDQQKQDQQKQDQQQEQQQQEQQQQDQQKQDQQQEQQQQQQQKDGAAPELTDEQAAQILKALDRDEEELKRSLQKRVQGGRPKSGKRW
ncbi:MAG: VWA domain-containing protein [bacterium]|nr:VWA domain-containing protein [bacterium]